MGYYLRYFLQIIEEILKWLFTDKRTKKMLKSLPYRCYHCEFLNTCRDEENNWKCHNGCKFIKAKPIDCDTPIKLNTKRFYLFKSNLPTKRVVIEGSKDFTDYKMAKEYIDLCISKIRQENKIIIVSSGTNGCDWIGEIYAKKNGFEIERYLADWDTYGKSAGPRRNKKIAEISDYVICFWDGKNKGTKFMIEYAKQFKKPLKVKKI